MAKTPRTTEAFHFKDFPVDDLEIRPPSHVVESLFGIPALKGVREPFINLSPNKGEWLRTCFDIEVDHISTLKDANGVPRAFKLVVDVEGDQEIFMNKLNNFKETSWRAYKGEAGRFQRLSGIRFSWKKGDMRHPSQSKSICERQR